MGGHPSGVRSLGGGTSSKASTRQVSSQAEREAVDYYVSGEGMWVNGYLRGDWDGGDLFPDEVRYLKDLEKATSRKIGAQTLYRSVDASAIFGNIDDIQYDALVSVIGYNQKDNWYMKNAQPIIQRAMGRGTITEKGFMSTTKDEDIARDWNGFSGSEKPIVMKITTSDKTIGRDISKFDKELERKMEQREVLLGKGQSYRIDKIYGKSGKIYVDVSMK